MKRISKTKLGPPAELAIGRRDIERTVRRALMNPGRETLEVMSSPLGRFDATVSADPVDVGKTRSIYVAITKRPNPRPPMDEDTALQILAHFALRLGTERWSMELDNGQTWVCRKRLEAKV